jgi:GAF domain-containing protein
MSAPFRANEHKRLQAVQRQAILDTAPEAAFDRITRLASHLLDVPIVLVTIVDRGRQCFKSSYGVDVETSRNLSFGAQAILMSKLTIVPDLRLDRRFASNALMMGNLTKNSEWIS